MSSKFKVSFTHDEEDVSYFRKLYRKAKKEAKDLDSEQIVSDARGVVTEVRKSKKTPRFVIDAIDVLADLTDLVQDEEYAAPKKVRDAVLAAIAYFSNPDDLIPDDIPGLGFLDDAIMIKFVEDEFQHELWGYRRFRKLRDSSEQRPWSRPARERLSERLKRDRIRIRKETEARAAKQSAKRETRSYTGW